MDRDKAETSGGFIRDGISRDETRGRGRMVNGGELALAKGKGGELSDGGIPGVLQRPVPCECPTLFLAVPTGEVGGSLPRSL